MVFWGAHVLLHFMIIVVLFFYLTNIIFFIKQSIALGCVSNMLANNKREWVKDKPDPESEMHLGVECLKTPHWNFGIKILLLLVWS